MYKFIYLEYFVLWNDCDDDDDICVCVCMYCLVIFSVTLPEQGKVKFV